MSSSSSSIERKKYNQISKNEFVVNEENDTSKKTAPALKNNFDSQEKLRKKQAWREQYESSSVENSDADNAESDRSINEGRKNNYLTASPAVVRGRPQSSAQEEFDIVTTAASTASTAPTATTATTTTTTTFASTITTTTVPAQNNLGQASAVTMSVSDSLAKTAGSQINFPKINSNEAVVLMKNFINDAERKKLIINFQGEEGWRELRNFLSADDAKNIGEFSGKKIILELDCVPYFDHMSLYLDVLRDISESNFLTGIDLKGDPVVKTWPMLKTPLGKNPNIKKLQISDATSDAVCGLFKIWMEYRPMSSANANPGLKITTLSFANLKIADASVFGSVLRNMVDKMPNLSAVDFSQTPLSAEQKEVLSFQLEPLGRKDLLQF